MSSPNNLEISGNLAVHPLSEMLVEISQSRLDGSLRVLHQTSKIIIYFRGGEIVFAASNQRQHRIFEMLLQAGTLTKEKLVEIPQFTNDLLLGEELVKREIMPESAVYQIILRQIEVILQSTLEWKEGIWTFSAFARIKENINYKTDTGSLLIEFARNCPKDSIVRRFRSFRESFAVKPTRPTNISLRPKEAFILSRFEKTFLKIEEIKALSGLSDAETLQNLYSLWLGGYLYRKDWNAAISEHQISTILSAKLSLKKEEVAAPQTTIQSANQEILQSQKEEKAASETVEEEPPAETVREITLEEYLYQVENATTHYHTLKVGPKVTSTEIKQAYFNLAKRFHPDLFHRRIDAATQQRIQHAFTEIAHAYETLRDADSRQTYDYRLGKVLEEMQAQGADFMPPPVKSQTQDDAASQQFELGFNLLMEEDYAEAMPYLARAVHLGPNVARFHAYYGKLLSADEKQRHKAESELQAAIKIEPENATFRIMLVEFFIQYNLLKRAEGELGRLLSISPDNAEALALLDSLQNK